MERGQDYIFLVLYRSEQSWSPPAPTSVPRQAIEVRTYSVESLRLQSANVRLLVHSQIIYCHGNKMRYTSSGLASSAYVKHQQGLKLNSIPSPLLSTAKYLPGLPLCLDLASRRKIRRPHPHENHPGSSLENSALHHQKKHPHPSSPRSPRPAAIYPETTPSRLRFRSFMSPRRCAILLRNTVGKA